MEESIVASEKYLNGESNTKYDPELIFFDHCMAMGVGSSGAGILNMNKKVVGLQSGEFVTKEKFMSSGPWEKLYNSSKTGNKEKDENLAISGASLRIKSCDIREVRTRPCNLNYAVHIAYLDEVLRNYLSSLLEKNSKTISLNDLILEYVYLNNYA